MAIKMPGGWPSRKGVLSKMVLLQDRDVFKVVCQISLLDVLQHFTPGLELRRQGRQMVACCPFHQERTPSFTVNSEKNLFYCFGCGIGGDAVDFVSRLLRLRPLEAAWLIARDFGLAVDDQPLSREARRKIAEVRRRAAIEKAIYERLEAEISQTYQTLCLLLRTTETAMFQALAQRNGDAVESLADLIRWLPWLEEIADRLYDPDPEKRLVAWEEAAKWIS
ncbi:MAG: CHC2 zinc finger domain-containing protein [Bacillota bacterium]